jgi:drug/metabolite transporter (DMT)-like permease
VLGCIASVFGAICAAFGSNYASLHLRGAGAWEVATGSFLFGGIMTLPLLWLVPIPVIPQWVDYGYLLIQGCIVSALAYAMYFGLVSSVGANKAISVEFFVTLVAVLVGTFLLHERLSMAQIFGGAAIVLGCSLILGLVSFSKLKLWYEAMFNP